LAIWRVPEVHFSSGNINQRRFRLSGILIIIWMGDKHLYFYSAAVPGFTIFKYRHIAKP
jgi:hypothetical protein